MGLFGKKKALSEEAKEAPREPALGNGRGPAPLSFQKERKGLKGSFLRLSKTDQLLVLITLATILVTGYFLFFFQSDYFHSRSQEIGTIEMEGGSVRRRHTRSLRWQTLDKAAPVYLGDTVFIPKETTAWVTLRNGKRIDLTPDTMVQFDESTLEGVHITLLDGNGVAVKTPEPIVPPPPPPKKLVKVAEITGLDLRLEELSQRLKGLMTSNQTLLTGLKETSTSLRNVATQSAERCSDYAVELIEPKNAVYDLGPYRWLTMVWSPIPDPGIRYQLEIALDPNFNQKLLHSVKKNWLKVQLDKKGEYYWRVRAYCPDQEVRSRTQKFTLSAERVYQAKPPIQRRRVRLPSSLLRK